MVSGFFPRAAEPPDVLRMESVVARHAGRGSPKLVVFQRPPLEVRTYNTSGLDGCTRNVRTRPVSDSWTMSPFWIQLDRYGPMLVHVPPAGTWMAPRPSGPYCARCASAASIIASMNSGV